MYFTVRRIIRLVFPLIAKLEYSGLDNIPEPPYLLAMNHLSAFDAPTILTMFPHRVRALAAAKHKKNPVYAPLLWMMNVVWVERGEVDRQALRESLEVLREGGVLGIAPEGTRSRENHALQAARVGAAYLATRADVPIVPVGLWGTEKVGENLRRLRRTEIYGVVGEPFRLPESGRVSKEALQEYSALIMRRIAELLPQEYRGIYG